MRSFIVLIFAMWSGSAFAAPITDNAALDGVAYRIDIPDNWNHELVVYYHGYSLDPITFEEPLSPMFEPFLQRHFAVLQSAYSQTGWAVEQGYADTEKLRSYFERKYGKPKRTFVSGMSMGGTLTVMTIEKKPDVYAGALSLCGALEPSSRMLQRDFSLAAAFDYYFPDVLGPLDPVPAEFRPTDALIATINRGFAQKPAAMRDLLHLYGAANEKNFAPVVAFILADTQEMQRRAGPHPFSNADLIYTGSSDDYALNDGVTRYQADAKSAAYVAKWYTPTGNLTRPMLALHDSGDPLVPASTAYEYALTAQRAGHGDNFVQQYVNHEGHCVFTPTEIGGAFDELVKWTDGGAKPESGKLKH
ncbi:MAG TPA: prolyl oligopeptidase family serine peptidase [Rudaea sp.]|jgi:pimeloyl-ACP methyl ester carboxylesterase|nr:prolyl oligopeptidase family serine peptidase [Rudaea sp.]